MKIEEEQNGATRSVLPQWPESALEGALCTPALREEGTVTLTPNLGKDSRGGICRGGNEFETLPACRPTNGGAILDDMGIELVLRIVEMESILHAAPANVK